MQFNIKAIFEKKRNILLFLLFLLGAYAFVQSVLTRGEIQYVAENVEIPLVNEVKIAEETNFITPEVLGDRVFGDDSFFVGKQENLPKKQLKPQPSILTDENEAPKIVLGYKEGLNEAWDICSDIELAKSFGFDTSSCQSNDSNNGEGQLATNVTLGNGGGGGNNGGAGNLVINPDPVEEIVVPEEEPAEEENPVEPVYASSSEAILTSWKIGGQEVIGRVGSEPMSFTQIAYKSGAILEVADPYTFQGISFTSAQPLGQIIVYTYHNGWSTWDLNYDGAQEALDAWVLQDTDTVIVKVISEDFSTTNWYKAKVFDANTPRVIPDFLQKFNVGRLNVLPLTGLAVEHHSMNSVDFGATLLVPDFTDFNGVEVLVNDWNNFSEAKVLIYHNGWITWDLKYEGALEDLMGASLAEGDMIVLTLEDNDGNSFWYRVNLAQGQLEEATEFEQINTPSEVVVKNSDSSLKDLLVGSYTIDLSTANVGPDWTTTSTGAVLTVDSFDDLIGVVPQASDPNSTMKVRIYRNAWITWEYDLGLDLVAKEHILANDRIVIEVTAEDGSQTYYQVQVTLKTEVENPPLQVSSESVSADEAIKPEQVEELKPENTDNDQPEPELKKEVEKVAEEISTDSVQIE